MRPRLNLGAFLPPFHHVRIILLPRSSAYLQSLHHSTVSNSRNSHPAKNGGSVLSAAESDGSSLFQAIKDIIIGAESLSNAKTTFETSKHGKNGAAHSASGVGISSPTVCGNACEGSQSGYLEETRRGIGKIVTTQLVDSCAEDVSPVVHKITDIVRGSSTAIIPMEDALERSGLVFNSEVVEKVLKRCFKVGRLAIRFFNWVKFRPEFRHTIDTYNTMIFIAGEAKEFGMVKKLCQLMEKESFAKDIRTWTIIISHYGRANMIGEALLAFDKMRKSGFEPDETAYRLIIRGLCNVGKAEIAAEFYKEMVLNNMEVDMRLYKLLLKCLSKSGDVAMARLIGDDMMKIAQLPASDVYYCLMLSFCVAGKVEDALQLFQEMKQKNIAFNLEHFNVILEGLCKATRVSDALELVDILKEKDAVDERIYGHIISLYLREKDVTKAFETFKTMKELGYLPSTTTYTKMIQHLFKLKSYEKANIVYDEMLHNGIKPDVVTMTAVVAGYVCQNHIHKASEAFEGMIKNGIKPTWKFYAVYIKRLCRARKPGEAFKFLQKMCSDNINPGNVLFYLVISSLEKIGELETVDNLKKLMNTYLIDGQVSNLPDKSVGSDFPSNTPQVAVEMSNCLTRRDLCSVQMTPILLLEPLEKDNNKCDVEEICKIMSLSKDWALVKEVLSRSSVCFTPELVSEIICNCHRQGHFALQFFKWVEHQDGYNHTSDTYNLAIKVAGSAKDFKCMRALYFEMKRKGLPVTANTWSIMVAQYGRAGLTEMALNKFNEMKLEGYKPNGSTYKYLIIFLCGRKGRNVGKAMQIFEEMLGMGHLPDKELVDVYLGCLCETGKSCDARKSVESLCRRGFPNQFGYSILIRALSRAGRLDEALALEGEIEALGCKTDQYIYGSLIHGLLRGGRVGEALQKVEAMKQVGNGPTVHVYTSFIVHYLKEGDFGKAFQVYDEMKNAGCEPTVVTYSALIRGYLNKEMVAEAWSTFNRMKAEGPAPDFKTYSILLECLCKIGRSEEALPLLSQMLGCGIFPSSFNFRTVFFGLNREGKPDLARIVLQKKWDLKRRRMVSL